jgi:2-polyprenyl-3-methyl-5-hydroxy-6-metoxy-1,4-benzoquinol methylase
MLTNSIFRKIFRINFMEVKKEFDQWHEDEMVWWNKNGAFMSYQWRLTKKLNKIIRAKLESDYTSFLFAPGERLLDLGCGSGWLSLHFANLGMEVLGIDVSKEQIKEARALKVGIGKIPPDFLSVDFIDWNTDEYNKKFDKVFVNAFLHHLPDAELEMTFKKIALLVKPGGKVFMYEPLTSVQAKSFWPLKAMDLALNLSIETLVTRMPRWLNLFNAKYKDALANGYTMNSPHERPIDSQLIKKFSKESFKIIEIKGWHLYSLGFAMQSMNLRSFTGFFNAIIARVLFFTDGLFFKLFGWEKFSQPGRFILCGIKLIRK